MDKLKEAMAKAKNETDIKNPVPPRTLRVLNDTIYQEIYDLLMVMDLQEMKNLFHDVGAIVAHHTDMKTSDAVKYVRQGMEDRREYIRQGM